jgi:lipoprotein NlpI
MRQLLFAIFIISAGTMTTFAQTASAPATKDSAAVNQKFYFPSSNYTDSIALIKAMPKLAEQVLSVYHDENRRTFFENSIYYYLLSEKYNKAVELVDSVQKIDDDKAYAIEVKSYALANAAEKKQQGSFEKVFKKEFAEAFSPLSFAKK